MSKLFSTISKMNPEFRKSTHLVFDMDGLLLDTEILYTKATQNILDPYGKHYSWDVKVTLMGLQREEVCKKIVEIYDLPLTCEEYGSLVDEQIELLMKNCNLCPGTEHLYEKIVGDIIRSFGKKYPHETRMKILGTTERRTCEIAVKDLQLNCTVDEFHKEYKTLCREYLSDCKLLKGAERLVRHLHSSNVPIALATSSSAESVQVKTTHHRELFKLFHHKVMGSSDPEVKEGKPAPDIFLIAARRFPDKPKPEDCLVFEDAPNGVKAARSAGMQVVMVPDTHVTEEQKFGATLVLNSLEEFKPEMFGLPPFKN